MCVYLHTYLSLLHAWIHLCVCSCPWKIVCVHTYVNVCAYMHPTWESVCVTCVTIYKPILLCMYRLAHMYRYRYACIQKYVRVYTCVCMHKWCCMCACVCGYILEPCVYMCMCVHYYTYAYLKRWFPEVTKLPGRIH